MNALVIGGGLTGSLIGFFLKRLAISTDLWECDRELAGRMKTFRSDRFATVVDVGAQYITTNVSSLDNEVYSCLLSSGEITKLNGTIVNIKPQPPNVVNFVAKNGMDSVVKYLINVSNFRNVALSRPARKLDIVDDTVRVTSEDGLEGIYDVAVITIPIPSVLKLEGNFIDYMSPEVREKLERVKYSCRDCLMMYYDKSLPVDWVAKYTPEDDVFRYVAIQERKIGVTDCKSSVIFHTSVQFGDCYRLADDDTVKASLTRHALDMFPEWGTPSEVVHYKWNYSQVLKSYDDRVDSVVVCVKPLIVIAGDGFTVSNVDGCIATAKSAAGTVIDRISER